MSPENYARKEIVRINNTISILTIDKTAIENIIHGRKRGDFPNNSHHTIQISPKINRSFDVRKKTTELMRVTIKKLGSKDQKSDELNKGEVWLQKANLRKRKENQRNHLFDYILTITKNLKEEFNKAVLDACRNYNPPFIKEQWESLIKKHKENTRRAWTKVKITNVKTFNIIEAINAF